MRREPLPSDDDEDDDDDDDDDDDAADDDDDDEGDDDDEEDDEESLLDDEDESESDPACFLAICSCSRACDRLTSSPHLEIVTMLQKGGGGVST